MATYSARAGRLGFWAALALGWMTAGSAAGLIAQSPAGSPAQSARAAAIEGTWQGTVTTADGRQDREVFQIARGTDGALKTTILRLDQKQFNHVVTDDTKLTGDTLNLAADEFEETYTGRVEADGSTIAGTLKLGNKSYPMLLKRATPDNAWPLPEPEKVAAKMDPKADPAFDVATIKLTDPSERRSMFYFDSEAHFHTLNLTLENLISQAWELHASQIIGLPSWATSDKFDIAASPDTPGEPNEAQLNGEIQKLIYERFGLKTHMEKRTMTAYRITVDPHGALKIKPSSGDSQSFYMTEPGRLVARDATIANVAQLLQGGVLDRPVVDVTDLGAKRYNFTLRWQIDDAQAIKMGMAKAPPPPENGSLLPSLLTALPEQLGLRLEAGKTPVDVLVIDHVEKPSAN